ncbi:MAG: spiro-SPASM protein [Spirochaetota bacterium]|nr:spiro-SPASM protein [Spirochaetota bacterium]
MKIDILLYIDDHISEKDLNFNGIYLPGKLADELMAKDNIDNIYYCIPKNYKGDLINKDGCFNRNDKDDITLWKQIFNQTKSDHIVKIYCDSPFLDTEIIKDMMDLHIKYLAEFTYSENLPEGYSCEIISKGLIETIPDSDERMLPLRDIIRSNINQFDVELYYKAPDIRDKRISFRSGNLRDKKIMQNIYTRLDKIPKYSELSQTIDDNPDVLYIGPSYIEIELTGRCELDCIFCYRNTIRSPRWDMDMILFTKILKDMESFQLPYSVCFGGSGEPMMHSNFYEILDLALKQNLIENIIIETNGIYADDNFKNVLLNHRDDRIKIIFNINGMDDETYNDLHGADCFQRVYNNITSIKEIIHEDNSIYIQIMKINETEAFLDRYYDYWENHKIPIILQKQNTYLGKIEDKRYSDLSPIERVPCWHLQRDLYILSDGRVIFCKQDIDGDSIKGNIQEESIYDIWTNSKAFYIQDYMKNYTTNPDCKSCDEWYTFNL